MISKFSSDYWKSSNLNSKHKQLQTAQNNFIEFQISSPIFQDNPPTLGPHSEILQNKRKDLLQAICANDVISSKNNALLTYRVHEHRIRPQACRTEPYKGTMTTK